MRKHSAQTRQILRAIRPILHWQGRAYFVASDGCRVGRRYIDDKIVIERDERCNPIYTVMLLPKRIPVFIASDNAVVCFRWGQWVEYLLGLAARLRMDLDQRRREEEAALEFERKAFEPIDNDLTKPGIYPSSHKPVDMG